MVFVLFRTKTFLREILKPVLGQQYISFYIYYGILRQLFAYIQNFFENPMHVFKTFSD